MKRFTILDENYCLSNEIVDLIAKNGFEISYSKVNLFSSDILFGRKGLSKLKASELKENKKSPVLACPMTNIDHIDRHVQNKFQVMKLDPTSEKVKNIRSSGEYTFFLAIKALKADLFNNVATTRSKIMYEESRLQGKSTMLEFSEAKVGLVGLGRNGYIVSKLLNNVGCKCMFYDPFKKTYEKHLKEIPSIEELFASCDCIILTLTSNLQTKKLINSSVIKNVRKPISIVNTSRPDVVDEPSIVRGIKNKSISLYLSDFPIQDKYVVENIEADITLSNRIFCSNHIGGSSKLSSVKADRIVIEEALKLV